MPVRIVSLLPSATEVVAAAGGEGWLVGRSHECDCPKDIERLPVLTSATNEFQSSAQMNDAVAMSLERGDGLYALESNLLQRLRPDVIVTQDLCAVCAVDLKAVQRCATQAKIVCLNPFTLQDVLEDVLSVGEAIGTQSCAKQAVAALQARIDKAVATARAHTNGHRPKVACLEWTIPLFPGGHWTPQLVSLAGGEHPVNPCRGPGQGAPASFAMSHEALAAADVDWIVVCPCGLDLEQTAKELPALTCQPWWKELRAVRDGKVAVADGHQMFNRPGPRLVDALEWLVGLLHGLPEVMPPEFPWMMLEDLLPTPREAVPEPVEECSGQAERDIEEAHDAAVQVGSACYSDPVTGYSVFTASFLRDKQGVCCGNRCRHCPFGHHLVEPWRGPRINRIQGPVMLRPGKTKGKSKRAPLPPVQLLVWRGDPASHLSLRLLQKAAQKAKDTENGDATMAEIVLLITFQKPAGQVWDCEDLQLGEVQDQARRLYCPMMAVPAGKDSSDLTAAGHAAVEALYPQQVSELVVPWGGAWPSPGQTSMSHTNDGLSMSVRYPLGEHLEADVAALWSADVNGGHVDTRTAQHPQGASDDFVPKADQQPPRGGCGSPNGDADLISYLSSSSRIMCYSTIGKAGDSDGCTACDGA